MYDPEETPDRGEPSIEDTWGNPEFIQRWVAKEGWQSPIREVQTAMVVHMVPHELSEPVRVLDLAAGSATLALALLKDRDNATAVCLDASVEMIRLGRERAAGLGDRVEFVQASLEGPQWLESISGTFDVVVSARALHHFTANQRRRFLFREIYGVLRAHGCFINADNVRAPTTFLREQYKSARDHWLERYYAEVSRGTQTLAEIRAATPNAYHGPHNNGLLEEELLWLREAGFSNVDCFWKFGNTVVYGGYRS